MKHSKTKWSHWSKLTPEFLKSKKIIDYKSQKIPMVIKPESDDEIDERVAETPFRELIGSLMILMLNTRPDTSAAVNVYSLFQSEPKRNHWFGLKRILRYLKGTLEYGLFYPKKESPAILCYVDSDWT